MVVISVSWKEFPKIDGRCRQDTHSRDTSVQYSLITARTAHSMRLAGLKARLKFKTRRDLRASLCPKITSVIWCVRCLIHGCSLTRLAAWALPLLHVLYLPQNENTQNIPHISKLPQATSCAFKNHSGVKTCRVAETRAQQLPQVVSPKNLRPSRESKLILKIHINYMMYRKIWRRGSPSSYHPRSGGIWRN